ncbi:3'-5' RNA helicase YTHDC2-like isoform X2 [Gigantopelta aegis]|nr:3'-5' RNA helicase YTHDC2-like isoform X2 [Gigantopelta aegis]
MGGDSSLNMVTHIIVDEIHERDRFSDFLLTSLKTLLEKYKNLRLILMSATLNIDLFSKYFNDCPVIRVPGSLFKVEEFFLEDILKSTNYTNKKMEKYKREVGRVEKQQKQLDEWCSKSGSPKDKIQSDKSQVAMEIKNGQSDALELGEEKEDLEPEIALEMDKLLAEAWLTGDEEIFSQIFHLIMSENVSVDYSHSETSVTPLMIASGRGFVGVTEQLLNLGANVNIRASNDWTALDWAKKFDRMEIVEILEANLTVTETGTLEDLSLQESEEVSAEDKELLNIYHHSFDDEHVDIDLVTSLVHNITTSKKEGAILIFLPGYDDIVSLRDSISEDKRFQNERFLLYTLHSLMQSSDQKRVFKTPPPGVRKIILATNIAETSITIIDVVFVIDCGKVKEKTFDALTCVTMLKSNWISKASAQQRRGRAGRCRPGVCYHLFSRIRFNHMQEYQLPEILRYPLQELCLHTKLLAPVNSSIVDYLSRCPEPPAFLVTRNAVQLLKQIDALDPWEELTELGHHLTDLPVEPRLGKMLLYSVVLKCLDPILTIVCVLAYKDPFTLPTQPYLKRSAAMSRRKFAAGTYSDHMALLRAFQAWQKARTEGWERSFCEKNFLSSACMEMVVGMRTQLLGQLRASGFVRARGGGDIRDLNTNSENWAVVKAALCAGMYPNLVYVRRQQGILVTQKEAKVRFHGSSVLSAAPTTDCLKGSATHGRVVKTLPSDWLIYEEMTRFNRLAYIRCSTLLSSVAVAIFAGPAKLSQEVLRQSEHGHSNHELHQSGVCAEESSDSESEDSEEMKKPTLHIDEWLQFRIDPEAANLILQLRQKWHCLFLRRMRAPSKPWSQMDESVVRAVINVLTNEEQSLGMQQPAGIGQRPRPMSAETIMASGSSRGVGDLGDYYPDNGRSFKRSPATTPQRKEILFKGNSGGKIDKCSSPGNNSRSSSSNSVKSSAGNTPCPSPQPSSPAKFLEPGATSSHPNRYFVMKCNNQKNLDISQQKGVWATTSGNESKLNKAFKDGKNVFLVFSIQGSGHFQGVASMVSAVGKEKTPDFMSPGLGGNFQIKWIKKTPIPFQNTHHLTNPWNENKKVQVSRDGQEIEPNVGESLVKMWDKASNNLKRTPPGPGTKILLKQSPQQRQKDETSPREQLTPKSKRSDSAKNYERSAQSKTSRPSSASQVGQKGYLSQGHGRDNKPGDVYDDRLDHDFDYDQSSIHGYDQEYDYRSGDKYDHDYDRRSNHGYDQGQAQRVSHGYDQDYDHRSNLGDEQGYDDRSGYYRSHHGQQQAYQHGGHFVHHHQGNMAAAAVSNSQMVGHPSMGIFSHQNFSSQVGAGFGPMYMTQMMPQSSTAGMMMPTSPRPGISPVVILQRGANSPGQVQGHPNFQSHQGHHGYGGGAYH